MTDRLESSKAHADRAFDLMVLADEEAVDGHRDHTLVDRFLAKALIQATLAVAAAIAESGAEDGKDREE